jgi:hypothetical protein
LVAREELPETTLLSRLSLLLFEADPLAHAACIFAYNRARRGDVIPVWSRRLIALVVLVLYTLGGFGQCSPGFP